MTATRRHQPPGLDAPVSLDRVLGPFRRGAGDPTSRRVGRDWWLAWTTPDGPVGAHLVPGDEVTAHAWGAGAQWFLDALPDLLGGRDDPTGFEPHHDLVAAGWPSWSGYRVPASRLVFQVFVPAVIEQRVTGREAFSSYRQLVTRFGEPAPGLAGEQGMICPPTASGWGSVPSWAWLQAGVEGARSRVVVNAAKVAGRLEECAELDRDAATRRLRALPGVGVWTTAEVAQRALGDADAVSFGDYHLARNVTWSLTGRIGDDDELAELVAPYAGHRFRACRIISAVGGAPPRRGPRRSLPTHLPTRF
ncbi:DNA-3-methyladenine glycosylase 2 family protein [Janibacter melonis]|uniref:DNA-3-methyladenine glycosylase family protein n=1 Tax=Janibacter melonis TaxID=262209 RepID=UPI0020441DCC|nr:DNA-3-methyladenine glycosylase 2 family protein [Janibacter melonis]MCM3554221.1 DNA-3-methyladenine glycosylase 2 family protein [Janibacter melonis]